MNNTTDSNVFFWLLICVITSGLILISYTFLQQFNTEDPVLRTVYHTCQSQDGNVTFVSATEQNIEYSKGREIVAVGPNTTLVCGYS